MLIGLIPYIRKDAIATAITSLSDCDVVYSRFGPRGEAEARNALLDSVPDGAVVRFCDDDDVASNTRLLYEALGSADVVAASYNINSEYVVRVPPYNALLAATNHVSPCNWAAKIESLRKVKARFGSFFAETWPCNTGARFWLRMIDVGLTFRFLPDIICYNWRKGTPGSKSAEPKIDCELYAELERRKVPKAFIEARRKFDAGYSLYVRT